MACRRALGLGAGPSLREMRAALARQVERIRGRVPEAGLDVDRRKTAGVATGFQKVRRRPDHLRNFVDGREIAPVVGVRDEVASLAKVSAEARFEVEHRGVVDAAHRGRMPRGHRRQAMKARHAARLQAVTERRLGGSVEGAGVTVKIRAAGFRRQVELAALAGLIVFSDNRSVQERKQSRWVHALLQQRARGLQHVHDIGEAIALRSGGARRVQL